MVSFVLESSGKLMVRCVKYSVLNWVMMKTADDIGDNETYSIPDTIPIPKRGRIDPRHNHSVRNAF